MQTTHLHLRQLSEDVIMIGYEGRTEIQSEVAGEFESVGRDSDLAFPASEPGRVGGTADTIQ